MTKDRPPRLLIIAGSDSSGGAGLQADIKTCCAFGVYAAAAVTAVTAQDTSGVHDIVQLPAGVIRRQIDCVLSDIGADAVKIGMIGDAEAAAVIAERLAALKGAAPVVLDPVLAATSGHALARAGVREAILERLAPLAAIITPNTDEAEALTGLRVRTRADLAAAARRLLDVGTGAVLMKGGHLPGPSIADVLFLPDAAYVVERPRIDAGALHGTGCTLATAIACGLARGDDLRVALGIAVRFVHDAIASRPPLGKGAGPLNHLVGRAPFVEAFALRPFEETSP